MSEGDLIYIPSNTQFHWPGQKVWRRTDGRSFGYVLSKQKGLNILNMTHMKKMQGISPNSVYECSPTKE